jgi:Heterokaryon incompatibility protein (HET)
MTSLLYQELNNQRQDIRLLHIAPSLDFQALIECRLSTASLATVPPPKYKALSYVWGDPNVTSEIVVNGISWQVTTNLAAALRRIRSNTDSVVLWADAICINQEDVEECSKQIGMMGLIYSTAQLVFVWLGEEADDSELAFDTVERWGRWAENRSTEETELPTFGDDMAFTFDEIRTSAIQKLGNRSYWTRVWVFQELVLAKATQVLCGRSSLTVDCFVLAAWAWDWLMKLYMKRRKLDDHDGVAGYLVELLGLKMFTMLIDYCRYCPTSGGNSKRTELSGAAYIPVKYFSSDFLYEFRRLHSTDPRDKVYGLLGILPLNTVSVIPDYSKSVDELFLEVARLLIIQEQQLKVLVCASHTSNNLGTQSLPSWVPNWELKSVNCSGFLDQAISWYKPNDLSFHISKAARFSRDNCVLYARGRTMDEVVLLHADLFPFFGNNVDALIQVIQDEVAVTGLPALQALFRTLCLDSEYMYARGKLDPSQRHYHWAAALFLKYIAEQLSKQRQPKGPESMEQGLSKVFLGRQASEHQLEELLSLITSNNPAMAGHLLTFRTILGINYTGRILFRTANGSMGLGPPEIAIEDQICYLVGHDFPFVLRKVLGYYVVVGECFVLDLDIPQVIEDELLTLDEFEIH